VIGEEGPSDWAREIRGYLLISERGREMRRLVRHSCRFLLIGWA